jgi:hypothetical protein
MGKIFAVVVALGLLVSPVVCSAQNDSPDYTSAEREVSNEESHAQSNLATEMATQESAQQNQMSTIDETMAGNSSSQQDAVRQESSY